MKWAQALSSLILVVLTGCAASQPKLTKVSMKLSKDCITSDLLLKDCDAQASTLECRKVLFQYKKGCEQILAKK